MQKITSDRPDVIIFPPVVLITTLAIAFILQSFLPAGALQGIDQSVRAPIGTVVAAAGVYLAAAGRRVLVRLGTNVSPFRPTSALATSGIYSLTRNPLYCGGTLVMIGVAFGFALDWMVLLSVPSLMVLHYGVVRREERYLEQKFGEEYRRYMAQVPRYGLGI